MKEDNKNTVWQKLSSRKLWAAVISFLVAIFSALFHERLNDKSISLIISGCASLWTYIVGEGIVDAVRTKKDK